ncbi:MAG: hypothetical protein ACRDL1_14225 [Solirubrobacterales bacterium]
MTRSSLRTIAAIGCVAALLTLLAVSVAAAAYKTGRYKGTTSQGEAISFKAKQLGVKKFAFTVIVDCDDGSRFELKNSGGQAPTTDRGKFEAVFVGDGTTMLKGKLKRKRAEGTFESETTAPSGAPCSAGGDWSAKKR